MESLIKLAEQVQAETARAFEKLITPEVMEKLTPEQKKAIAVAQNPLSLSGGLSQKIDELQKLIVSIHGV